MTRCLLVSLALVVAATLAPAGCDLLDADDLFDDDSCRPSFSDHDVDVEGTWKLSGDGDRRGCHDAELNTTLELSSIALEIEQDGNALRLARSVSQPGATFAFTNADVTGECVRFETTETGGFGTIQYEFDGAFSAPDSIAGEWSSTGPSGCRGDGSFTVRIDR